MPAKLVPCCDTGAGIQRLLSDALKRHRVPGQARDDSPLSCRRALPRAGIRRLLFYCAVLYFASSAFASDSICLPGRSILSMFETHSSYSPLEALIQLSSSLPGIV